MLASKLYELNSAEEKVYSVETHLGSSIHTTHKHNVITILNKVKEEKIYLAPIPYRNNVIKREVKRTTKAISLQFHIGIM